MQTVVEEREMPMEPYAEKFKRVDERFDDVDREFKRVDERFVEVNRRITEGREEAKQRFDRVEGDIRELKQGLFSLQATLNRFILGAATGWVILIATFLAKGG
jgi:uncharacterized coiled-coil DUF342 family protein